MSLIVGVVLWLVFGPLAPLFQVGESWSQANLAETRRRGAEVSAAVDAYIQQHAELPPNLDVLVPDYIAQIKPPTAGDRQWEFGPSRGGPTCYILAVDTKYGNDAMYTGPVMYSYTSCTGAWDLMDNSF